MTGYIYLHILQYILLLNMDYHHIHHHHISHLKFNFYFIFFVIDAFNISAKTISFILLSDLFSLYLRPCFIICLFCFIIFVFTYPRPGFFISIFYQFFVIYFFGPTFFPFLYIQFYFLSGLCFMFSKFNFTFRFV